jgi:ABC-type uncharacterized transport system substrate-binding protein
MGGTEMPGGYSHDDATGHARPRSAEWGRVGGLLTERRVRADEGCRANHPAVPTRLMTRSWRYTTGIVRIVAWTAALAALPAGSAMAHPHVFVDYTVALVVVGDRLTGVRLTWTFDDLFSGFVLQEFDKDRNGLLSPAEAQRLEEKHLPELKRVGYYTTISINGKPVPIPEGREFRATAAKGIVTYEFTLPLGVSLASTTAIEVVTDDPVYYIAYIPAAVTPQTQTIGAYSVDCRVVQDKTGVTPDAVRCGIRRR